MTASLWLIWLIPMAIAGIGMAIMTWWDVNHPETPSDKIVTLGDILTGAALAIVPLLNIFVSIGVLVYFVTKIAPNIVIIGRSK